MSLCFARKLQATHVSMNLPHSYGTTLDETPSSLQLPSSYLTRFDVPIQIIELRMPQSNQLASLSRILENPTIYQADVPIIVCNSIATSLSTVLASPLPHNTILVLSSGVSQADLDEIIQQKLSASPPCRGTPSKTFKIIAVDPKRAVEAVHALQSDSQSVFAIQRFQTDFLSSAIVSVTHALDDNLKSNSSTSPLLALRLKTALYHIQDALCAALTCIREVRHDLDQAFINASNLRAKIEETQARIQGDIFGSPLGDKMDVDQVTEAIRQAEAEMRPVMDNLTWWRMAWRVDEISSIVGHAATRAWCQPLEKKVSTGLFFTNIVIHKRTTLHPAYSTYWLPINTTTEYDRVCIHTSLFTSKCSFSRITQHSSPNERTTKISSHT